jgi:transposase
MNTFLVLTDIDQSRVREVVWDRTIAACYQLWKTLTKNQLQRVRSVSMDMWQAFITGVATHVPEAKNVHDKFERYQIDLMHL